MTTILKQDTPLTQIVRTGGSQGPAGPVGPAGSGYTEGTAGVALGGHRVVRAESDALLYYADSSNLAHFGSVIGITSAAVGIGGTAMVATSGFMDEPSWAWTPQQAIYFDSSGILTQTPPVAGFGQTVGEAITATRIFVRISQPIELL